MSIDYLKDLGSRVAGAFLAAFLGALTLGEAGVDLLATDWKAALSVGGGAAVASLLKGLVARFNGNKSSASLRR